MFRLLLRVTGVFSSPSELPGCFQTGFSRGWSSVVGEGPEKRTQLTATETWGFLSCSPPIIFLGSLVGRLWASQGCADFCVPRLWSPGLAHSTPPRAGTPPKGSLRKLAKISPCSRLPLSSCGLILDAVLSWWSKRGSIMSYSAPPQALIIKTHHPGAGEMAQWSRAVAAPAEDPVQFPAPTQRLTTFYNCSSMGSHALFWCTSVHAAKTLKCTKYINKYLKRKILSMEKYLIS